MKGLEFQPEIFRLAECLVEIPGRIFLTIEVNL